MNADETTVLSELYSVSIVQHIIDGNQAVSNLWNMFTKV